MAQFSGLRHFLSNFPVTSSAMGVSFVIIILTFTFILPAWRQESKIGEVYILLLNIILPLCCFHSYPRLKLTFTIIAMQKSRSHPPFILYEDCLTMWADLRELDYNVVACTRKQILRLQDISKGSGLYFYPSQWQSGKITACHPKGLRFDSRTGHLGCGHYVVRSCTLSCFHSYPRLKLTFTIIAKLNLPLIVEYLPFAITV